MAPQALSLSGLLCVASLSFITAHDGLHQLTLTEQESIISLSSRFLICRTDSQYVCLHVMSRCRISGWYGLSVPKKKKKKYGGLQPVQQPVFKSR